MKKAILFILFLCHFPSFEVLAESNGAQSIEWVTLDSDVIITGRIEKQKDFPNKRKTGVILTEIEVLKGDAQFPAHYPISIPNLWFRIKGDSATNIQGNHIVLFLLKTDEGYQVIGREGLDLTYINLSKPYIKNQLTQIAITQDMKVLKDSASIIEIIKQRVQSSQDFYKTYSWKKGSNLSSWFYYEPGRLTIDCFDNEVFSLLSLGSSVHLTVPADPKWEKLGKELVNDSSIRRKIDGIRILMQYKSTENIEIIKSFLTYPYQKGYDINEEAKKALQFMDAYD